MEFAPGDAFDLRTLMSLAAAENEPLGQGAVKQFFQSVQRAQEAPIHCCG